MAVAVKDLGLAMYAGKRKHGSQMTPHEESGLWKRLKAIQEWEWELLDHVYDRLKQKKINVTKQDIISTIFHSSIVEYKIDWNRVCSNYDERVVLRSKAIANGKYNLHAVFSLTNKNVVSVWLNHIDDRHETLKWELYDANMRVFV